MHTGSAMLGEFAIRCNLASLSSGASAASLPLIQCNLASLSSGASAAILSRSRVLFRCEVTCFSLAV